MVGITINWPDFTTSYVFIPDISALSESGTKSIPVFKKITLVYYGKDGKVTSNDITIKNNIEFNFEVTTKDVIN